MPDAMDVPAGGDGDANFEEMSIRRPAIAVKYWWLSNLHFSTSLTLSNSFIAHKSFYADEDIALTTFLVMCPMEPNLFYTVVVHLGLTTPKADSCNMASSPQWCTADPHNRSTGGALSPGRGYASCQGGSEIAARPRAATLPCRSLERRDYEQTTAIHVVR